MINLDFMDWVRSEESAGRLSPPKQSNKYASQFSNSSNYIHPLERPFFGGAPDLDISGSFISTEPAHPSNWKFSPESNGVPAGWVPELEHAVEQLPTLSKRTRNWRLGIGIAAGIGLFGLAFSGKDDNYNNIEGLLHGGAAQDSRRRHTPFGSGWDALRNQVAEHLGSGSKIFDKFVKTPTFQESLAKAELVKPLGEGSFGVANLMKTSIKIGEQEHPLEFVRKTLKYGENTKKESTALQQLGHLNAPTFYGRTKNSISMEHIEGTSASQIMLGGGKIEEHTVNDLSSFLKTSHEKGFAHSDLVRDVGLYHNSFENPNNYTGQVVPHNVIITPQGRAGVIDYGETIKASTKALPDDPTDKVSALFKHYLGEPSKNKTAADLDLALVQGLRAQQGKISPKYTKNEQFAPTPIASVKKISKSAIISPEKNKMRKLEMAATQKATNHNMFENARTAGKRSKSSYVASHKTVGI